MNNALGSGGALLSGLAGGYTTGKRAQDMMNAVNPATKAPQALGVPGGATMSATGATGLPQTAPALPSTPETKAATDSGGNWQTLASILSQSTGQKA